MLGRTYFTVEWRQSHENGEVVILRDFVSSV